MTTILLVEDNKTITKGLEYLFTQNHFHIVSVSGIEKTREYLQEHIPDIIILDILLSDGNGFTLYEDYIKNKNIPTIFLTAYDNETDIVSGLNMGAEDYITKPFSNLELLARVNKVLLRNQKSSCIKIKDITIDLDKMEVYKGVEKVNLTSLEMKIMSVLVTNLNKVVTRARLAEFVWEATGNDVNDNTITVYLKRLREKIGSDIIITVKGIGYRIDEK